MRPAFGHQAIKRRANSPLGIASGTRHAILETRAPAHYALFASRDCALHRHRLARSDGRWRRMEHHKHGPQTRSSRYRGEHGSPLYNLDRSSVARRSRQTAWGSKGVTCRRLSDGTGMHSRYFTFMLFDYDTPREDDDKPHDGLRPALLSHANADAPPTGLADRGLARSAFSISFSPETLRLPCGSGPSSSPLLLPSSK
jgi:hypothetical protein